MSLYNCCLLLIHSVRRSKEGYKQHRFPIEVKGTPARVVTTCSIKFIFWNFCPTMIAVTIVIYISTTTPIWISWHNLCPSSTGHISLTAIISCNSSLNGRSGGIDTSCLRCDSLFRGSGNASPQSSTGRPHRRAGRAHCSHRCLRHDAATHCGRTYRCRIVPSAISRTFVGGGIVHGSRYMNRIC